MDRCRPTCPYQKVKPRADRQIPPGTVGDVRHAFDRIHTTAQYLHMRTNIDIDDKLMAQAMRASEKPTKRAVVEEALHLLVRTKRQTRIRKWRGKVAWEGDLEASRAARVLG